MTPSAPFLLLAASLFLAGCERLGIADPAVVAATAEADGKAIGAACRNAGRGLEDCYQKNPKGVKSAIFTGWKEMNEYMSQNKMEVIAPPPPPPPPPPVAKAEGEDGDKAAGKDEEKDAKSSSKASDKEDEKPAKKAAKHG